MTDTTDAHDSVSDDGQTRRRFLTAATSAVGVGGVAGVAVPFLGSWNPSEKAKAAGAPVRADISKLEPGQMVVIEWRGKPVYVLRRTPDQVAGLTTLNDDLKDPSSEASAQPDYIEGDGRAINEEFLGRGNESTNLNHLLYTFRHRPQHRQATAGSGPFGARGVPTTRFFAVHAWCRRIGAALRRFEAGNLQSHLAAAAGRVGVLSRHNQLEAFSSPY